MPLTEPMDITTAARIMREATKDKTYQLYPMGEEVAAYLRSKRKRLTDSSYRGYESCLDKLAREFPDLRLEDFELPVGAVRLEEFLDNRWGGGNPGTYNVNLSILSDFFRWQVRRGRMHSNPCLMIERAKKRQPYRSTYTSDQRRALLAENDDLRDRLAIRLMMFNALRKGSLRVIQFKHFDFGRRRLTIFAKGGKVRNVPIPDANFWRELEQLQQPMGPCAPDHYLMFVRKEIPCGSPDAWGHRPTRTHEYYDRPMSNTALHRWWKRCLERAGIDPEGQGMHKMRHTSGQMMLDATGNLKAVQKHLGHATVQTTADIYTDWDEEQLAASISIVLDEEGLDG